ncbi:aminotransferase class I/II-fold pyridoxal phosphate-dependent enzyme [Porphyrobacter algicida]|uniref:Aminotransferase class I/II-fold pyridoxal phosphate-dependent enzyme n=1 Tax=Qipengyuania algicida TaxID=1836209 RepID=A0A845AHD1_9SPHN|nr:DegT/DnrJ/EryC1/StrS family aminotransferase [Qipengyuania algicida]MXP27966.1 aminotransferase class I/II-fold pyridoxal phosphate-dependent enzyme [Qipengyuania algicida]
MRFIDLHSQYDALRTSIHSRIDQVLAHGQYIMGPEVVELEGRLANFTGANHCITVASGTEALLISLMALGIGPGDEVITTPFTFVATAEVIVLLGARPIFVDVESDTCNIDPDQIARRIGPKTKAIVPVSLYGQIANMDEVAAVAQPLGIPVIEDGAQSFGALYRGRRSCATSLVGCTSFFPSKPLGCYGDGGAIFTDDPDLAHAMREIRTHGQSDRYYHTRVGVGGRMDTLQCAVVLAKLERFDWEIERRQFLGQYYSERLSGIGVSPVTVRSDRTCVWGQYTVFIKHRDRVREKLQAMGVPTAVHYPRPLHRQPAYEKCDPHAWVPNSEEVASMVMSLPMGADLSREDQNRVIDALSIAIEEVGE